MSEDEGHLIEEHIEGYIEDYIEEYASVSSIVREALPFEIICMFGGVIAGIILFGMVDEMASIAGLLVIVPAVMAMRGNISCALGSRLGSAIHMGLITKIERNPELTNNIVASLTLSFILAVVLGFMGHYVTILMGLPSAGPFIITSITIISGVVSGIILAGVAVLLATMAFRFGLDPDNIITPAIGTIGDIVTMLLIFASSKVMLWLFIA
ncbi:MAG: magnesium transporter [Halobacteriota archaeon]|nr:magnesium transporter [Halobacteriota archaeon]